MSSYDPKDQVSPPYTSTDVTDDDPYDFLRSFDIVFLIDDSWSMKGRSWRETTEALKMIALICTRYDSNGIDLYFLNHPDSRHHKNVTSASTVIEIFQTVQPDKGTPTGQRLDKILKSYIRRLRKDKSIKPMNVIVITDGVPSDDVEGPIIAAAESLHKMTEIEPWQIGIQFFQVGNERGAREHLKKLDDDLPDKIAKRCDGIRKDMVDTVPFTGPENANLTSDGILKVV